MCGDATSFDDVEKLMQGGKAQLALTDPPYGINIVSHVTGKVGGNHKAEARVYNRVIGDESTETAQKNYNIIKDFADNHIIFGGNYFTDFLPPKTCWVIWDKENGDSFLADGEMAWTSFDKGMKIYRWLWNGMSRQGDRQSELKERVHPTQKPVGMLASVIKDFSQENNIVIDCFGGSGSTLIACEQTGRNCYMMELSEQYCDIIIDRWEQFTGKQAVLLNG